MDRLPLSIDPLRDAVFTSNGWIVIPSALTSSRSARRNMQSHHGRITDVKLETSKAYINRRLQATRKAKLVLAVHVDDLLILVTHGRSSQAVQGSPKKS